MADDQPLTVNKQRLVRVFVSSTFRDMHDERDELVKFTFPELRKRCRERAVEFVDVDLRWGIPDEQKAEGKVLPICLAEIERCHPYFIGLLGERYGWVPEEIDKELAEVQPWLKEHKEKSVTELEIIHSVFKDPEMKGLAFFYFRNPDKSREIEEKISKEPDYQPDPSASRSKLKTLKENIRKSHYPVREDYPDAKSLGQMVLDDLWKVIEERYPIEKVPTPLERERMEHEAFALARTKVYIGREEYFKKIDEHVAGDGLPLVLLGESGSGKSALIANWIKEYRQNHPDDFMLLHFIGSSPYSTDWKAMLRRIMGKLKERFDIPQEIPDKPDELRMAFANYLHMASAKGRVILILDALNQLEDNDNAPDLVWLPPVIPENIRLILSTLPGRPLDDLRKRGWQELIIEPFNKDERRIFIERYLKQYTRELSPSHSEPIASANQTANPLYLQALLEELKVVGRHETLGEIINHYLEARTIPALYEKILDRYEGDYDRDRKGLVQDAMSYIWAGRRGLTEEELLNLLGRDGNPLPRAFWSPLYLAAEQLLVNRSGLINFFHDYLREAVKNRYLPTEQKQSSAHIRLADYFETLELFPLKKGGEGVVANTRKVDELPWQLQQAREWQRLYNLMSSLDFFKAVWLADQFETKAYWARLENNSLSKVNAYEPVLKSPELYIDYAWYLATLFTDTGHPNEAFSIREYFVNHYRKIGDIESVSASLGSQANILYAWGRLDEAMRLYKEQEEICRKLGNKDGLSNSLCGQALILKAWGKLDEAMKLYKEEERICKELGNKDGLQRTLGNQANILYAWGRLDEAMKLYKEEERICKEIGNPQGLAYSLINQAYLLSEKMGRHSEALPLAEEAYRLATESGLESLAQQIKPILEAIRKKSKGDTEKKGLMEKFKKFFKRG